MAIATDILTTLFEARGISNVVGAFGRVSSVEERYQAAHEKAAALRQKLADKEITADNAGLKMAEMRERLAMHALENANMRTATYTAFTYLGVVIALTGAVWKAVSAYEAFGKQVMNIRDITGVSGTEASKMAALGRVAGLQDASALTDLMRSGSAVFGEKGQVALARLGIPASINSNGLALFNQVADKLQGMQAGLLKTQLMEQLFGAGGAQALLPLLRLTKEQRAEIEKLGASFSSAGLDNLQRFEFSKELAKLSFELNVLAPVGEKLIKVFTPFLNLLVTLTNWWERLDKVTRGAASWVTIAAVIGVLINSLWRMIAVLRTTAIWEAVVNALMGPAGWKNIAIAGGIGAAVGFGGWLLDKKTQSDMDSPASKMDRAGDKMLQAAGAMTDVFDQLKGSNMPGDLTPFDIASLQRHMALGAIG